MSESMNIPGGPPQESGEYILINAYEDLIKTNVWSLMQQDPDTCKCEKCFLDTCALVFNNKRYNYTKVVTTRRGSLLVKLPEDNYGRQAEMTVAILDAIKTVKETPRHD